MGTNWITRSEEFIPTTGGNDRAPEAEQVKIYFRPFAVREKGMFVKGLLDVVNSYSDQAAEAQKKLAAATKGKKKADAVAIDDDTLAFLAVLPDEQEHAALEYVFQRVIKGTRGKETIEGHAALWEAVSDDSVLVTEICGAIVGAAGVDEKTRPF